MQDTKEFKKTERFAMEEAKRERLWQDKFGSKISDIKCEMNNLLKEGTESSRKTLRDKFLKHDFFEHYRQTDMIATMFIVMSIYEQEYNAKIYPTILDCESTVDGLQRYLEQLKFILYRIDFFNDNESKIELVTFIKNYHSSMITIETMISTATMRQMNVALQLEKIFEENKMYKELFHIRYFTNNRWPGNCRILMRLCETYEKTMRVDYLNACRIEMQDGLEDFYHDNLLALELQELLWRYKYKELAIIEDLVNKIQIYGVETDIWKKILEYEKINDEEYYLLLTEKYICFNMNKFALATLEIGIHYVENNNVMKRLFDTLDKRLG